MTDFSGSKSRLYSIPLYTMSHTIENQKKLLVRVRRIKGQLEGLERALSDEQDCALILQQIASIRGATNGLMTEVLEGHLHEHIAEAKDERARLKAADELTGILRSYLK